ncbi:MAG: O-methyltransferase [Bacilli bacterium]|nr:O-methyltransferase [Bacilli bacterium]
MNECIKDMERYAEANNVPIIEKDSIEFINKYIKLNDVKKVLEIGTAIGYSAIMMAKEKEDLEIVTIEKDDKRYREAIKNIKTCELDDQIEVVFNDALEVNLSGYKFDLIFIDAAKGQYIKYFDKFKYYLSDKGVIVTDNLKFHGLVEHKEMIESKNVAGLVNKLEQYIEYLKSNDDYTTKFFDVGDGLSVSYKNNNEYFDNIN